MFMKKRSGWFIVTLFYLFSTLLSIGFINPRSASAGDIDSWVDGSGNTISKSDLQKVDWTKRLKFLSPINIYDTQTKTTYSYQGNKLFMDGTGGLLTEGGQFLFFPDGKSKSLVLDNQSNCYGVINWYITDNTSKSNLELAQPKLSDSKIECSVAGKVIPSNTDIDPPDSLRIIDDNSNGGWGKYYGNADWLVAPFYWTSKDSIGIYDTTRTTTKLVNTVSDNIKTSIQNNSLITFSSNTVYEYWQPGNCKQEVLVTEKINGNVQPYGYFINFDSDPRDGVPTTSKLIDIGTQDSDCMLGRTLKGNSYDVINYQDSPDGKKFRIPIAFANQINDPANNVVVPPPSSDTAAGGGNTVSECEDKFQTFGVIVCFILESVDRLLGFIEGTVSDLLDVNTDKYSASGDNGNALYQAWLEVVRVSSGVLAIIAIIMVLSTALGDYRLFDSYTVKKVLPRIVIAAIAMWLSWALVTSYINAMNTIGRGVADLMWEPFKNVAGNKSFEDWGLSQAFGTAQSGTGDGTETIFNLAVIGGVVAAGSTLASGGVLGLISALFPVVLFMIIGFLVLVLREAIIVFLLITAPFAIVTWVLPNTQKVWDKWSKFLNQLLFMYPMFMGILAAGKIFSFISSQTASDNSVQRGFIGLFVPVAAYITPYALLPGLFKSAGGALSKVTGVVSKQGNKISDRVRKPLDEYSKQNKQWKTGVRQNMQFDRAFNSNDPNSFSARRARAAIRMRSGQNVLGKSLVRGARGEAYNEALGRASDSAYEEAYDKSVKTEDLHMRTNEAATYNNRGALRGILANPTASAARKQVALDRLITMRQDGYVRQAINGTYTYTDDNGDVRTGTIDAQRQLLRAKNSGSLQSAFGDSAPDIARAEVGADNRLTLNTHIPTGSPPGTEPVNRLTAPENLPEASKVLQFSRDSLDIALSNDTNVQTILNMVENDPDFASNLNAEKLDTINAAVHRIRGGGPYTAGSPLLFTPAQRPRA